MLEFLAGAGDKDMILGMIMMGDEDYHDGFLQALSDFASSAQKMSMTPGQIKKELISNLDEGKAAVESHLNDTFIPMGEYVELVEEISEEIAGFKGEFAETVRECVETFASARPQFGLGVD